MKWRSEWPPASILNLDKSKNNFAGKSKDDETNFFKIGFAFDAFMINDCGTWQKKEDWEKCKYLWLDQSASQENKFAKELSDALGKISSLLHDAGYEGGNINLVALLGSIGEAGETLEEFIKQYNSHSHTKLVDLLRKIHLECNYADGNKKNIRDERMNVDLPPVEFSIDVEAYDAEIADELYYLLAKMKGRGETLLYFLNILLHKLRNKKITSVKHANIPLK